MFPYFLFRFMLLPRGIFFFWRSCDLEYLRKLSTVRSSSDVPTLLLKKVYRTVYTCEKHILVIWLILKSLNFITSVTIYRLVEERRNEMSCPNVKLLEGFWSVVNFYTGWKKDHLIVHHDSSIRYFCIIIDIIFKWCERIQPCDHCCKQRMNSKSSWTSRLCTT